MAIKLKTIQSIWAALILSALLLGGFSGFLLHKESERIRTISDQLREDKETALQESLIIVFSEIESGLMDSLTAFPEANLEGNLEQWARSNPFVEVGFTWRDGGNLTVFPNAEHSWQQSLTEYLGQGIRGDSSLSSTAEVPRGLAQPAEDSLEKESVTPEGRAPAYSPEMERVTDDAGSGFLATRQRVREVTKEAYFEQRAQEVWERREAVRPPTAERAAEVAENDAVPLTGTLSTRSDLEMPTSSRALMGRTSSPEPSPELSQDAPGGAARNWHWVPLNGAPQLVGWFRPFPGATLRGLVVDREVLFQTLRDSLPRGLGAGGSPLILESLPEIPGNSNGGLLSPLPEGLFPGATLVLQRTTDDVFNRTFWLLAALLILVLVCTFFFGASLLLWMARRTAADAMRKTDFLSNVSHELKTPLTTIRMYAEMLEAGRVESGEKQHRYLQTIHGETRRLTRLVNNVLQFSALQKGKTHLQLCRVDLVALAEAVCDQQEMRIRQSELRLCRAFPEDRVEVAGDADALEQCIINLMDNALKYGGGGAEITCRIQCGDGRVKLTVEDHGPGIPRDQQQKIFEAFHRLDDSLTASQPGSGLGLSICQSLVRQMNGDIHYESLSPQGSLFIIDLPTVSSDETRGIPTGKE